jgi:uncharacterized membrane protein
MLLFRHKIRHRFLKQFYKSWFLKGASMSTVVALFYHFSNAEWAVDVLEDYGVEHERISVIASDKYSKPNMAVGSSMATGAAAGGLVGLLAGLTAFMLPGIGLVVATGSFANALFLMVAETTIIGAGLGAATGGLLGLLVDLGLSEGDAKFYAESVKRGGILVTVETDLQDEYRIRAVLRGAGAMDLNTHTQRPDLVFVK